jgi:hypothetical protein
MAVEMAEDIDTTRRLCGPASFPFTGAHLIAFYHDLLQRHQAEAVLEDAKRRWLVQATECVALPLEFAAGGIPPRSTTNHQAAAPAASTQENSHD